MRLGIISDIGNVLGGMGADEAVGKIGEFFSDIVDSISKTFTFATSVIDILPMPFNVIFKVFLGIILSVTIYKVVTSLS